MAILRKLFWIGFPLLMALVIGCAPPKPQTEIPITTKSEEARSNYVQARSMIDNLEMDKALPLIDHALQLDPEFASAYLLKSQASSGSVAVRGNREKALSLIDKVTPGERWAIKYSEAQGNGKTALAKLYLDSLLTNFPKDKRVQMGAGLYYNSLEETKKALEYFQAAAKLDTAYGPPYNQIGYAQMDLGNSAEAENAFKKYIRLLPNSPNPLDSYAEFLLMSGRYDESIQQYEKVLKMDPTFISSLTGLGNCHARKGEAQKARECYQQYIDKSTRIGEKISGHYLIAAAYVYEGKIPEALQVLDNVKALALQNKENPAVCNAIGTQGYVLSTLGNASLGLKKYQEAVDSTRSIVLPDAYRENYRTWTNMWMAYAYAEAKNLPKAKELFAIVKKDVERRGNPGEANALTRFQGNLDVKEGKYDDALRSLATVPEDPWTLYNMMFAYVKKADMQNAAAVMDRLAKYKYTGLDHAIYLRKATALRMK